MTVWAVSTLGLWHDSKVVKIGRVYKNYDCFYKTYKALAVSEPTSCTLKPHFFTEINL